VRIPSYLSKKNMAMRHHNEIIDLDSLLWAERLDIGLQRVLAANLQALLPSYQIRPFASASADSSSQVFVTVEQFEVDSSGKCALAAAWRIVFPRDGGKPQSSGRFSKVTDSSPPDTDPKGAVDSMSSLAAELSQELARALNP
jgi:uncharacterized lipoprotein YmbA